MAKVQCYCIYLYCKRSCHWSRVTIYDVKFLQDFFMSHPDQQQCIFPNLNHGAEEREMIFFWQPCDILELNFFLAFCSMISYLQFSLTLQGISSVSITSFASVELSGGETIDVTFVGSLDDVPPLVSK